MSPSIVYIPAILGIVVIALLTLYNRKVTGVGYFSLLSFCIAIWLSLQYAAQLTPNSTWDLALVRASSAFSNLMPTVFLAFVYRITSKKLSRIEAGGLITGILLFIPLNFTNLMINEVEVSSAGIAVKSAGVLYSVQIALQLAIYIYSLVLLLKFSQKSNPAERSRYRFLAFAVGQAMVISALGTTIFTTSLAAQYVMVLSFLLMVALIAYAIVRHQLFDIRLLVARSVAYILTVITIGGAYSLLAFSLTTRLFFQDTSYSSAQQLVYTLLALILVFTFLPIKSFFDRASDRIFYRDAYDSGLLQKNLGQIFAQEIEINKLAQKTVRTITEEAKLVYASLLIKNDGSGFRIESFGQAPDLKKLKANTLSNIRAKIAVIDNEPNDDVREHLREFDVSLCVRLVTQEGVVGYLILGPKQSGNNFNSQDVKTFELISNSLAIAIQNTLLFERISQFNISLQQRVDDATRKLRRTNEKLKALDETKDDFISMASHQLRTPLTSIKGYISMVMEGDAGKVSKTQQEMLTQAFFSSQRMVYLISDLLNVSRLKTGKFVIEPTRVNLATMVEQEMNQLKEAAAARNLTLSFDRPDEFPDVMLDETKTRQVIMNFADNAIYYTPAGGHIRVRLIDTPSTVEFRVEDNGIGVAKSDQPHLFTKFYRAGNARKARPDGTGLGLFMAKKVIAAEEGSIIFTSEEGKGSTFGFVFSKSKVLAPPTTPEKTANKK